MANRRVQMDLSEKSFERLKNLQEKVEAASYSEVMKEALRLYDWFIELDSSGSKFFVEEEGKALAEIKVFI